MNKSFFLFGLLVLNLLTACGTQAQQQSNLDITEFQKAIQQPGVQVLDVRTMEEFQSGHLKDAFLADWTKKEEFQQRVAALDKSKPVYTYCLSGGRSSAATQWLKDNGFTAYNLVGGMTKWKQEGKPVENVVKQKQISKQEYEAMIPKDKVVLVDVSASWCPPCVKMKPVIDSLVDHSGKSFSLLNVDGAAQTDLIKQLNVEAFPTFIIYKNGKESWRKSGVVEAGELVSHM